MGSLLSPVAKRVAVAAWLALLTFGAAGIWERVAHGHAAAGYGSYVIWGLWVSVYIYFIGLSAGSFLLSSLIYVFGMEKLHKLGRLSLFLAILTLGMALTSIWFDLGRMERAYRMVTAPNFGSMMAWMVWLYAAYMIVMIAEFWLAMRSPLAGWQGRPGLPGVLGRLSLSRGPLSEAQRETSSSWLRTLALAGVPLAVAFHGGVGALFSTISARPYWHTPLMPILFLTGALVSGGGLMAFVTAAFWPRRDQHWREALSLLGTLVLGLLAFDVVLEWAEFSVPMWYGVGDEYHLLMEVLFGSFWWVFWIVHIGIGTVIPGLLLLFWGKRPWAVGTAGLLIATTFLSVRLNIVIPGLVQPHLEGLVNAFIHPRLSFQYTPTIFEWQVTAFILALGLAAFWFGRRFLPLFDEASEGAAHPQDRSDASGGLP